MSAFGEIWLLCQAAAAILETLLDRSPRYSNDYPTSPTTEPSSQALGSLIDAFRLPLDSGQFSKFLVICSVNANTQARAIPHTPTGAALPLRLEQRDGAGIIPPLRTLGIS